MQDDLDPQIAEKRQADRELIKRTATTAEAMGFVWLMGEPQGRRVVHDLLAAAGIWRTSFSPDPYTTAFNEGQRNVGLRLMAQIQKFTPAQYAIMIEEHKDGR